MNNDLINAMAATWKAFFGGYDDTAISVAIGWSEAFKRELGAPITLERFREVIQYVASRSIVHQNDRFEAALGFINPRRKKEPWQYGLSPMRPDNKCERCWGSGMVIVPDPDNPKLTTFDFPVSCICSNAVPGLKMTITQYDTRYRNWEKAVEKHRPSTNGRYSIGGQFHTRTLEELAKKKAKEKQPA